MADSGTSFIFVGLPPEASSVVAFLLSRGVAMPASSGSDRRFLTGWVCLVFVLVQIQVEGDADLPEGEHDDADSQQKSGQRDPHRPANGQDFLGFAGFVRFGEPHRRY
jgi:hypothetical protein